MARPLLLLAIGGLLACGGSSTGRPAPAPAADPGATASPTAPADTGGLGAPKIPWAQKTREQRLEYMGLFVLPAMEKRFAAWRPDEFGAKNSFRCQNCHGEGFDKPPVDFHMPRVSFPLDPDDPIGKAKAYDAEAARFMAEEVVPEMARLLGEEPYDPATGQGTFGCFRCHPKKGEKVP